jgi:hypothetical protein
VTHTRIKNNFTPSHFDRPDNGFCPYSQTIQDIVTKFGTATRGTIPLGVGGSALSKSSARRRCGSEKFTFFAFPEKFHQ